MNLFECTLASGTGGNGADLIVTCDSSFAGSTITCTDGNTTFTETCPSSSPYTVTFESIPTGTWTISGVVSGQTFSVTKTITDFTETLSAIPDGSTVTPTDDIQTWLHCANIYDKAYTTISAVLADTTTLLALISSNNAVDYMARSTTWASDVCANSTAMTYIGANNYCADTLLVDNTWRNAICNSAYFESVLNVKVPTMTTNTTPSGECFADSTYSTDEPYKAFNGDTNERGWWSAYENRNNNPYVGYEFTSDMKIYFAKFYDTSQSNGRIYKFKYQAFDGSDWTDISTEQSTNSGAIHQLSTIMSNISSYSKFRIYVTQRSDIVNVGIAEVQFWGRTAS